MKIEVVNGCMAYSFDIDGKEEWGKKNYPVYGMYADRSFDIIGWSNFLE